MNWIVPGKFIAFSGPLNVTDRYGSFTPDDYVPIFKRMGVSLVVRLNKPQYEKNKFVKQGIKHLDLFFIDGTAPPDEIVPQFLTASENETGAIAIHCKAGLGRTGTLIGLYCMKHFGFPPAAFIGWIRIARPGSILGPQQQYLNNMDQRMLELGGTEARRRLMAMVNKKSGEGQEDVQASAAQDFNAEEAKVQQFGDTGQGGRLTDAKKRAQQNPGGRR